MNSTRRENLERVMKNATEALNRAAGMPEPPLLYLDRRALSHLYEEITGVADPPRVEPDDSDSGVWRTTIDVKSGLTLPAHILYQALGPIIAEQVPDLGETADTEIPVHRYGRLRGLFRGTRFPDGNLNLEIFFRDIRGLLFHTPVGFSSSMRPLLKSDRFHRIEVEVEAVVLVAGGLERMIFYHQTHGDDREHAWLPLAPVAIRALKTPAPD